jgi:hypothetical protein
MSIFQTNNRRVDLAPRAECPLCHMEFTLGVDGTVDGCDRCLGVTRASNGYVVEEPMCWCFERVGNNPDCPVHGGQ